MSVRVGDKVIAGGNSFTVDSALDTESINPVQNSVVARAINTALFGDIDCGTL